MLAAAAPEAAGQVIILSGDERPTCSEYFGYLARMLGKRGVPVVGSRLACLLSDLAGGAARLLGRPSELGRNTVWMLSRRAGYSIAKAERLLGYRPRVPLAEGMAHVEAWCRATDLI